MSLAPIPDAARSTRGVYVAEFLPRRGDYILYGVDRRGYCVVRRVVPGADAWEEAVAATWQALDERDPMPRLHLLS